MAERRSPKPNVVGSNPTWPVFSYGSRENKMGKIKAFLSETVVEMKKVVWPSWPSAVSSMKVVLVSTIIFAMLFGVVDFLLLKGLYTLF